MKKPFFFLVSVFLSLSAWAGFEQGVDFFERKQYKEARNELQSDAENGHLQAMAYMGEMYLKGWGGGRDEIKARDYITRSANEGQVLKAVYLLGSLYLSGNLVAKDENKGVDLIQKAAQQGYGLAQTQLGIWLYRGQLGYATDHKAALAWFKTAADLKEPIAMNWMGHFHEMGLAGISKDHLLALDWYRKSALLRHPDANLNVGRVYLMGLGVQADPPEALKWLRRAAVLGSSPAQLLLAQIHEQGRSGIPVQMSQALAWYSVALSPPSTPTVQTQATEGLARIKKTLSEAEFAEQEKRSKTELLPMIAATLVDIEASANTVRKGVYGSGVLVSPKGEVVTNAHVIDSCQRVRLQPSGQEARVLTKDVKNDLALLKIENISNLSPAQLRLGKGLRQGDEVIVVGFPLKNLLSSGPIVTQGIVNSLSGMSNDSSNFQISATVQPGSSGGGIWDRDGLLVGLVKARLLSNTAVNAQNVNFGIQLANVMAFLDSNSVDYSSKPSQGGKLNTGDASRVAIRSSVQIECY